MSIKKMATPKPIPETLPATQKTLLLQIIGLLRCIEEESMHLQVDRSLIVIDDRNASEQRSRQLPYEVNLEPVELLFAAFTMVLAINSHVRDVSLFVDVP